MRSVKSLAAVALDAIDAHRAMHSAHTPAAQRAVLQRFAADLSADVGRSAP